MTKRNSLEIKKEIMKVLKVEKVISVKKLEKKVNTNYQSIITNCEELEYFGFVKIKSTIEGSINGREYLIVELIKSVE